jgi:hypothetical protein
MKKIYLLLSAAIIASTSFAQYRAGGAPAAFESKALAVKVNKMNNNKAPGDSLFYFNSEGFFIADAQDNIDFALTNEDYDGFTPAQTGWPTDFIYSFYDDTPGQPAYNASSPGAGNFFPQDNDTAWYIGASSWFTPAGTANNYWNFGPITIPANTSGNTFNFFDKHNPSYTDSYDVYILDIANVTDPANPNGVDDILVGNPSPPSPVFSKTQINNGANAADTLWTQHAINIDAFAGKRIFVYFHHNANDGDILALDEMWVKEGIATGIDELNTTSFNVYPNPSKGQFNINLSNNKADNVNLIVRNLVGKTIINRNVKVAGQQLETISLTDYSKGVYFLTIENKTVKLIVE